MPQSELPAGSLGNERQGCIVLPKVPHAQSERHLLIHARDRDFAQHANREQKSLDVQVIGGSRHGLTTGSREIQPAQLLSWFSGASACGTISRRDSAQPWLLQVGTPSFGSSHCVKTTYATRNPTPQTQLGMFNFSYLPTPSLRRNVIIGHQFVNPD